MHRNGARGKIERSKEHEEKKGIKIRLMAEITADNGKRVVAPIEIERGIPSVKEFGEAMYAKGMSQRDIEETIQEIYGAESSQGMISRITDKLPPEVNEWQNRPLEKYIR